ncbi:MAG: hypothetical protein AAGU27_27935 [Dehalobacterium sp.]
MRNGKLKLICLNGTDFPEAKLCKQLSQSVTKTDSKSIGEENRIGGIKGKFRKEGSPPSEELGKEKGLKKYLPGVIHHRSDMIILAISILT